MLYATDQGEMAYILSAVRDSNVCPVCFGIIKVGFCTNTEEIRIT